MSGSYAFSAAMWPSLAIIALTCVLGAYSWTRRYVPGALPFAVACLGAFLWAVGSLLENAASDPSMKSGWYLFKASWLVPTVCATTVFVLQYARLGHRLTRRVVLWGFVVPSVLLVAAMWTNALHGLAWPQLLPDGPTLYAPSMGIAGWTALMYAVMLSLLNLAVLLHLFVVSPMHRWPAALMVLGQVFARVAFAFEAFGHDAFFGIDPEIAAVGIPFSLYAVALFGFHLFDLVLQARRAAIQQMREGLLVFDPQGRVAYVNPSAEAILGGPLAGLLGRFVSDLPTLSHLSADASDELWTPPMTSHGRPGAGEREYRISVTDLIDPQGQPQGRMLLFRDVTDEHRVQNYLLDEQRALAALRERERLARELHDSIGQVLGYVSLQAQSAQKWLTEGDVPRAAGLLDRLTDVAQEAHADVREAILALKAASPSAWSFLPTLREYAKDFERQYGTATEVTATDGIPDDPFEPGAGVQVLRVIQEAMSNARKHSSARALGIDIERTDSKARITVWNDGAGIDSSLVNNRASGHFGLTFMRERMAEIGGSIEFTSRPEGGTLVVLTVPFHREQEVGA